MDKQREYTEKQIFLREKLTWDLQIPDHAVPRLHKNKDVYHHPFWFSHTFLGSIYVKTLIQPAFHFIYIYLLLFTFHYTSTLCPLNLNWMYMKSLLYIHETVRKKSFKVHSTHLRSFLRVLNFLYFKPLLPMLLNILINIKEFILFIIINQCINLCQFLQ